MPRTPPPPDPVDPVMASLLAAYKAAVLLGDHAAIIAALNAVNAHMGIPPIDTNAPSGGSR